MNGIRTVLLTASTPADFWAAVEDTRAVLGWTSAHLARKAGWGKGTLHNAITRQSDIGRSHAVRLVNALCAGLEEQTRGAPDA